MSLLLLFQPSRDVKFRADSIKLVAGHLYAFKYKIKSSITQYISTSEINPDESVLGNQSQYCLAATWTLCSGEFTADQDTTNGILQIHMSVDPSTVEVDDVEVIDKTMATKNYRVMGIKTSMTPGNFTQTLKLREVTSAETA